jgi:DNA-binding NarL/FixJ family response regulator
MTKIFIIIDPLTSITLQANESAARLVQMINKKTWVYPDSLTHVLQGKSNVSLKAVLLEDCVFVIVESNLELKDPVDQQNLSKRQRQVLKLLSEGLSIKQIADKLKVSVRMVNLHLAAIKTKLGTKTNAQSVSKGIVLGYCRPFMRRRKS